MQSIPAFTRVPLFSLPSHAQTDAEIDHAGNPSFLEAAPSKVQELRGTDVYNAVTVQGQHHHYNE